MPRATLQSLGRAGAHTARAGAAKGSFQEGSARKLHVGENRSQSHPWPIIAGNELAMLPNPSQSGSGGCRLVREVALDAGDIGAI